MWLHTHQQVSSVVQCSAVCLVLSPPCEAFLLRNEDSTVENQFATKKQVCIVYKTFETSDESTAGQGEAVYIRPQIVTQTTTTPEPVVTTTPMPRSEYEELDIRENFDKTEDDCSSDKAIAALVLTSGDETMSNLDYFECRRIIYPDKMNIDNKDEEFVMTEVPNDKVCTENRVLVAFEASDIDGNSLKRWENPKSMKGICHKITNFNVSSDACEIVGVSSDPWIGADHLDSLTWNTTIYCPQGTLAVGMTRETLSVDSITFKITSLKCCTITFIQ
ncbi:uncharacterized protein LOC123505750 [Portunus trituberculatus]|uniref:uncharacterized protein LOC123505750 n=1 Tax=Portunus trituberculatus TaxID=210409 RepID=UPI001E1CD8BF|nr:uncharacterized protein LOC123505750 [Portunus trituberculatus]